MEGDSHDASNKAVHATAKAQAEIERAREVQMETIITRALSDIFSIQDGAGQKRFIDITRVPLICQSIVGIHDGIKKIEEAMVTKDQFAPVRLIVYGGVATLLTGVIGALLASVFIK